MFPKTHITIAAAATVVVTAAILMSPSSNVEAKRMSYSLDLEQGTVSETGAATVEATPPAGAAKETQPEASAPEMAVEASKQVSVAEPEQTAADRKSVV